MHSHWIQLALAASGVASAFGEPNTLFARAAPSCSYVLKNPAPTKFVCGKQGTIRRPAVITTTQTDQISCVNSCLSQPRTGCVSFSYGPGNQCTLYSSTILGSGFRPSSTSGITFWNRNCYTQTCVCPNTQTLCSGNCVDTSSDSSNCGACGRGLGDGDDTCCSGVSTNTQSDAENCGACGQGLTQGDDACCSGASTNTQTNVDNCGGCGHGLGRGDNACCSGASTNTNRDNDNCGACGQSLNEGDDTCCSGASTNTQTDVNNCGRCGQGIGEDENACCSGTPANTLSDNNNCGACGQTVPQGSTCCAGLGVDTSSDKNNCGSCGTVCQGINVCLRGACTDPTPVCSSTPVNPPVEQLVNGNFDTGYVSAALDPPWGLLGSAEFFNGAQYAQSPPVFGHIGLNPDSPGGTVYQDIAGVVAGSKYQIATFFRPYALYPAPTDSSVDQKCTMTITFGSKTLFTRAYTQTNGTQSGYSYVVFSQVTSADNGPVRLSLGYSCPPGYLGNGVGDFFFDSVSVKLVGAQTCTTPS